MHHTIRPKKTAIQNRMAVLRLSEYSLPGGGNNLIVKHSHRHYYHVHFQHDHLHHDYLPSELHGLAQL